MQSNPHPRQTRMVPFLTHRVLYFLSANSQFQGLYSHSNPSTPIVSFVTPKWPNPNPALRLWPGRSRIFVTFPLNSIVLSPNEGDSSILRHHQSGCMNFSSKRIDDLPVDSLSTRHIFRQVLCNVELLLTFRQFAHTRTEDPRRRSRSPMGPASGLEAPPVAVRQAECTAAQAGAAQGLAAA